MKAIILAAGFGKRLQPLTFSTPKPLIRVGDKTLIEHNIIALRESGIRDIIINLHYLGDDIKNYLGNGSSLQVNIVYSIEEKILDTGGAIIKALPLLTKDPFVVISGDIYTEYNYKSLLNYNTDYAHLVFVPNPDFNLQGDFAIVKNKVCNAKPKFTYANIGLFHPQIFTGLEEKPMPLFYIMRDYIETYKVTGELFTGLWFNIGTYAELNNCKKMVEKA